MAGAPAANSVGWFILEGYPWWPVFVVDQHKLRAKLYHLGDGHRKILKKARDFPKDYAIVYYFGSHEFSLAHLNKGVLRAWGCDDKEEFLKGHPRHLAKKKAMMDELTFAIQEAEDYLSQSEDVRLPPYFVPSDLDPTLEPPPPPPVEEEDEEGSDEENNGSDAGDGDGDDADAEEDAPSDGHEDDEEEEAAASKKPAKKKKEKKEKPKKEKKERKPKKEKKKADVKEKKTTKAASTKDKKKPPSKAEPKKRKAEAVEKGASAKSPSKTAKHAAGEDVKSAEKAGEKGIEMADTNSESDLTAKLEKEIRWILLNCQFEEMTTKTVRKLLEKRLKMDLRKHKASIKEGVARVIQSMEDGMDTNQDGAEDDGQNAGEKATNETVDAEGVKKEEPKESHPEESAPDKDKVKNEVKNEMKSDPSADKDEVKADPGAVKDEVKSDPSVVKDEIKTDPSAEIGSSSPKKTATSGSSNDVPVAEQLEDASKRLSASPLSEEQILDTLGSIAAISTVDSNILKNSKLQECLVTLASHSSSAVSSKVIALGKQWGIEKVLVPKKEVNLDYLKELKAKLERSETSHEDVCACLDELAEMPLQISHLKKTKIARTVANLRQHANDRVSSKANSLRKVWIQTLSKENPENIETLKTLKKMHETLAQRVDQADKPDEVHSAQLDILTKLLGMTLRTQDIIDSKVGFVVSKLRKSSDEKVAKVAVKLRKKWKSEAGAA